MNPTARGCFFLSWIEGKGQGEENPVLLGFVAGLASLFNQTKPRRPNAFDVQAYQLCEYLSELLLYLAVLFSPWAFGTTQRWSIGVMNIAGFCLGGLLSIKLLIRWLKRYQPPRWDTSLAPASQAGFPHSRGRVMARRITKVLALLTLALLGYCLVSALNARATYREDTFTFEYHKCFAWLPHSFDSAGTWSAFWMYLGLACVFWALRDWLLGKSRAEQKAEWQRVLPTCSRTPAVLLPARLRRLLWLLAINSALLGTESIAQRLAASPKLLFLVKPRIHQTAESQFGPYAYRSNAAQYFNLAWPVCLGFWWTLHRSAGRGRKAHHLVLVCAAIIAACPIASTSRAGAAVTVALGLSAAVLFPVAHLFLVRKRRQTQRAHPRTFQPLTVFFSTALLLGAGLGWTALAPRLDRLGEGFETRQLIYEAARPMAQDFPAFGTGPGTFEIVSYLYPRPSIFWPPQLHNDWLETLITFGWAGCSLLAAAFLLVLLRWFAGGGVHAGRRFIFLAWLALAGCLAHARFDFPFQVHSILFLFLLLCAILSILSRRP